MSQIMDNYKLNKNYYYQEYGPKDMDVVNITLIKIDDLLDTMIARAFLEDFSYKKKIEGLPDRKKEALKFLNDPERILRAKYYQ